MSKVADLRPKPRASWPPVSFKFSAVSHIKCLPLSEIRVGPPTHKIVQALFVVPHAYLCMDSKCDSSIVDISRAMDTFPTRGQTSSGLKPQCLRCYLHTAWILVEKRKVN